MILSSHALIGSSVGRLFPSHPLVAFLAGVMSHYAMDAIPHWEYRLPLLLGKSTLSVEKNKINLTAAALPDLALVGIDFAMGILLSLYIFRGDGSSDFSSALVMGTLGGILPDALQFLHRIVPKGVLNSHQRFHDYVHAKFKFAPLSVTGILLQIVIVAVFIFFSRMAR